MPKTTTAKTVKKPEYTVSAKVLGKVFSVTGSTISEAFAKLKVPNAKGKAIISVERGTVRKDRVIMPIVASRLFNSQGITREVALKNISIMFDGI